MLLPSGTLFRADQIPCFRQQNTHGFLVSFGSLVLGFLRSVRHFESGDCPGTSWAGISTWKKIFALMQRYYTLSQINLCISRVSSVQHGLDLTFLETNNTVSELWLENVYQERCIEWQKSYAKHTRCLQAKVNTR